MNPDHDLEPEIISVFSEMAPMRPPEHLLPSAISSARRKRRWPRWYALIKEPTMHSDSRLAVGSPMARVAAVMVATLLLLLTIAGAGLAGARILAAGPIIVAQDGSGTHTTITDAVAEAEDGDTVQVRPGTYHESIVITKDIILLGDGDSERESVIIEVGDDGPIYDAFFYDPGGYGILLDDSEADISHLTFRTSPEGTAVVVKGGAPLVHDIFSDLLSDDDPGCCPGASVYVHDGSTATVSDSTLEGWVFIMEDTPATIQNNQVGRSIQADVGDAAAQIIGNDADGIFYTGSGLVAGNDISLRTRHFSDPPFHGIQIQPGENGPSGEGWTVRDNTVAGESQGINVANGTSGTISGNILRDNQVAITLASGDSVVDGNSISGGGAGIIVSGGSSALVDNVIEEVSARGIAVGANASPTLSGNRSCDNGENLSIADGATPIIDETNDICEDEPTEPAA